MGRTIAQLHGSRILEAIRSGSGTRRHHLVLYMPTVPGNFKRDSRLIRIPGTKNLEQAVGMPVSLSLGSRGGRLWGLGFAKSKFDRAERASSYQLFRVDYHRVQIRDHLHQPPYAQFFQRDERAIELHWQIPTSPSDATAGFNEE